MNRRVIGFITGIFEPLRCRVSEASQAPTPILANFINLPLKYPLI